MFNTHSHFSHTGLSTLYKEKSIITWAQPMDIHYLSSWLFFYQLLVAAVLSPFIYLLQGNHIFLYEYDSWFCLATTAHRCTFHPYCNLNIGLLIERVWYLIAPIPADRYLLKYCRIFEISFSSHDAPSSNYFEPPLLYQWNNLASIFFLIVTVIRNIERVGRIPAWFFLWKCWRRLALLSRHQSWRVYTLWCSLCNL